MRKIRLVYLAIFLFCIGWSGNGEGRSPLDVVRGTSRPVLPAAAIERERVIVAFGDSLTAGFGVAADEAYPALLEKKLRGAGYRYRVINAGVSGDTTAGGLRRVDWILRNRPDLIILELGANDGLRGLDIGLAEKNLAKIIERLQKEGVKVVLAGMKMPPNYGKAYTDAFEQIYPNLAARYRIPLIPFFLEGVAARSFLNQADGIHPTAEGYRIIVDHFWPILEGLLKKE
ncbi:MAG: arylesterase [Nitrospiria bacterium]